MAEKKRRRQATEEELQALGMEPKRPTKLRHVTEKELEALGMPLPKRPEGIDLTQQQPEQVTPGRAALLGASQGASLGFADEIGAQAVATSPRTAQTRVLGEAFRPSESDTPEQRRIKKEALDQEMERLQHGPTTYKTFRDSMRAEASQAAKDRAKEYWGGELAGAMLTAPLATPAGLPGAIAGGALMGGVAGAGGSNAELDTEGPELAKDALKGAALGAGAGLVGHQAPRLLRLTGSKLRDAGVALGRKHLLGGTRTLGPNLKELSGEAVEEALKSGAILPFGTTKGSAVRLERGTDDVGRVYGEILETLDQAGVARPEAKKIADRLLKRADETFKTTGKDKSVSNIFRGEAENVAEVAGTASEPLGAGVTRKRKALDLMQAEKIKRDLQSKARYGRYDETPQNEARKEAASIFREEIEDTVEAAGKAAPADSEIALLAESFEPVKRKFGRLAEARDAAVQGARAAANRATLGLSEKNALAASVATGDPVMSLKALGSLGLFKGLANRAPSTGAAATFWGGKGAQGAANLMSKVPPKARTAVALAIERALDLEPPKTEEELELEAALEALKSKAR